MFTKNKLIRSHTRHYSGRRLVVDQLDAKVVNTGTLDFNVNSTVAPVGVELYVSETGLDTNVGTQDKPFATLTRAFERLTQTTWDGGAQIYIDGAVSVTGTNFNAPLEPAPGVSGKPYEISVKGLNVSAEGIFTVTGNGAWGPGAVTRWDFDQITLSSASTTASKGKMVHFKTGNLAGLRIPIYDVLAGGTILRLLVPVGSVFGGDTLEIETHNDSLELSGGEIEFASLSRLPLCIRNLDINTADGFFTSNDLAGTIHLLGVKVDTALNVSTFETNVFAEGLWITGAGSLMDNFSRHCDVFYALVSEASAIRTGTSGLVHDYFSSLLNESTLPMILAAGETAIYRLALTTGSRLIAFPGSNVLVYTLASDAGEVIVYSGNATIADVEVINNVSGILISSGQLWLQGAIDLNSNTSYGLSAVLGARVSANYPLFGTNGVAGIRVDTGSNVRVPTVSTISGPVGAATDGYSLNGVLGGLGVSAIDPADLAQIGVY